MFVPKSTELSDLAFSDGMPGYAPVSVAAPVRWRGAAHPLAARILKRTEDIVIAGTGLLLLTPLMLLVALLIRLTSPGPALFRQERIGQYGRRVTMYKFRTMHHRSDPRPGPCPTELCQATRHDARVTWLGALLRRSSFDELPQLINVLLGEMSVVGPRPHAPGTCAAGRPFEHITHRYGARHCVKPGMTGLAQVRGWRGETDTEEKLLRRLECDLEYIETWSLRSDLDIVLRTAGAVLQARNAY